MATAELTQRALLEDCARELEKISEEARRLAGSLSEEQLRWVPPDGGCWVPPDGGWSVAQIFDHLARANGSYLPGIRAAIARQRGDNTARSGAPWKPTLFGRMLVRSLDPSSTRALPAPRIWRPSTEASPRALEAFLESQTAIAELVRDAEAIDLNRARLSSPANRFIRLNVGDAFRVFVVHDWRHLGQVRRVMTRAGFPATG